MKMLNDAQLQQVAGGIFQKNSNDTWQVAYAKDNKAYSNGDVVAYKSSDVYGSWSANSGAINNNSTDQTNVVKF